MRYLPVFILAALPLAALFSAGCNNRGESLPDVSAETENTLPPEIPEGAFLVRPKAREGRIFNIRRSKIGDFTEIEYGSAPNRRGYSLHEEFVERVLECESNRPSCIERSYSKAESPGFGPTVLKSYAGKRVVIRDDGGAVSVTTPDLKNTHDLDYEDAEELARELVRRGILLDVLLPSGPVKTGEQYDIRPGRILDYAALRDVVTDPDSRGKGAAKIVMENEDGVLTICFDAAIPAVRPAAGQKGVVRASGKLEFDPEAGAAVLYDFTVKGRLKKGRSSTIIDVHFNAAIEVVSTGPTEDE